MHVHIHILHDLIILDYIYIYLHILYIMITIVIMKIMKIMMYMNYVFFLEGDP